jgi:hypothetical protein
MNAKTICTMLAALLPLGLAAAQAEAQTAPDTLKACYVNGSGTVYRTGTSSAPGGCTKNSHIPFRWIDGAGAVRNGEPAGGDLGGTWPAPGVVKIQGRAVSNAAPVDGQVLGWNGAQSRWEPRNAPAGNSGGVAVVTATGFGLNPASWLNFIGPTAAVTVTGGEILSVTSQKVLGSVAAGGGVGLKLDICYRSAGGSIVNAGQWLENLRVPSGTRIVFTLNAALTLPAGVYDVGMCGLSTSFTSWNDNVAGRTTVLILPAT